MDGFNAGEFFEAYLEALNPEVDYLVTRPQRKAKWFKIHMIQITQFFERAKVGENQVGQALPRLSEILGIPRITNGMVRPSAI